MQGIPQAPVFHPSEKEFEDAHAFIWSKRHEIGKFGFCRIVPPPNWCPSFRHSEETCFHTKEQHLGMLKHVKEMDNCFLEKLNINPELQQIINQLGLTRLRLFSESLRACGTGSTLEDLVGRERALRIRDVLEKQFTPLESSGSFPEGDWSSESRRKRKRTQKQCKSCKGADFTDNMLECSDCHSFFHSFCILSPKRVIFTCKTCRMDNEEIYGYQDGEEYSIKSFKSLADSTFHCLFPDAQTNPPSSDEIASRYWKYVDESYDVTVEYGNDLETTKYGSGFSEKDSIHWNCAWNVFKFPVSNQSLLQFLNHGPLSGVNKPWVYFGMIFSTFAWHCEDHHLYSINYSHFGAGKRWYGVCPDDLHAFQSVFKNIFPELIDSQPDVLFQLITMLNPDDLASKGVRVFTTVQNAGEFVITVPGAYHCGFNEGFNCAEAVNFALDDWIPHGVVCELEYVRHRISPVFSFERIIFAAIEEENISPRTAAWFLPVFDFIMRRNVNIKREMHHRGIGRFECQISWKSRLQCVICHRILFSYYFHCKCSKRVSCFEHIEYLCKCELVRKTLVYKYSIAELEEMRKMVEESAIQSEEYLDTIEECSKKLPENCNIKWEVSEQLLEKSKDWLFRARRLLSQLKEKKAKEERTECRITRSEESSDMGLDGLLEESSVFIWEDSSMDPIRCFIEEYEDFIDS